MFLCNINKLYNNNNFIIITRQGQGKKNLSKFAVSYD